MVKLSDQIKVLVDGYIQGFGVKPNRVQMRHETYMQLLDEILAGMGSSPEGVKLAVARVHGVAVKINKVLGVGELRVDHNRRHGKHVSQHTRSVYGPSADEWLEEQRRKASNDGRRT